MGRKKKSRLPPWLYEDNPESSFGIVTSDLLRSKQFQGLSLPAKHLLIVLIAHAKTRESQQCCFEALVQYFVTLGSTAEGAKHDAANLVHQEGRAFVFPAKHYQNYGFERRTVCKYTKELKECGFIELMLAGKNQFSVNIYRFSDSWKRKNLVGLTVDTNNLTSTVSRHQ